jgi:deazaflavin-dependent oxidoreductase (nitroreductase family)
MSALLTERVRTGVASRVVFSALGRLFELGLGRLVGHRFLQLSHRGRTSGRVYRTVLEVISYDSSSRESVVLSGWGERADWYRNIHAAPALLVVTAGERYAPAQRSVEPDELYTRLATYVECNRLLGGIVRRTLGLKLDGSEEDRASLYRRGFRGIAFQPVN